LQSPESCVTIAFMDAVERAKQAVGGASELARRLSEIGKSITSQAVTQWRQIPALRAHDVEHVTGIPVHELRPDLWPEQAA